VTAQESFAQFTNRYLAPGLRTLGFKGSGRAFELPSASHWVQLGIQRSRHSDASRIDFTLNCQVIGRAAWDEARRERSDLPERPSPNTRYGTFAWDRRIGLLMPDARDTWWTLTADTDQAALATEVLEAVRRWALPAYQGQASA
jgi:hypothetical protein